MISVIIPNHNHSGFIAQSLQSILGQTRLPDEVIVIDDASTDDSVDVIRQFAARHSRVKLARRADRAGVVHVMNQGLGLANGDMVFLLAADDYVMPDFLELSEAMMARFPDAPFCSAGVEIRNLAGRLTGSRPTLRPTLQPGYLSPGTMHSLFSRGDNFFLGAATLYRKRSVQDLGGFDEALGSACDGILQRRLAVRQGACFIPKRLAVWRIHGTNHSLLSVTDPETLERLIAAAVRVFDAEPRGLFPEGYSQLFANRLRFNAARLLTAEVQGRPDAVAKLALCIKAGRLETSFIGLLAATGRMAPTLLTAWLAIKMRPFSFPWLARERVAQWLAHRRA